MFWQWQRFTIKPDYATIIAQVSAQSDNSILVISSPFIILYILYEVFKALKEERKERRYRGGGRSINIGSINMFNKHYTDNNYDSHDHHSYR